MSTTTVHHPNESPPSDPSQVDATGRLRRHRVLLAVAFCLGITVGAGAFAVSGLAANAPVESRVAAVRIHSGETHTSGRGIVASWVEDHDGWVYVYEDGRVLTHAAGPHPVVREGEPMTGIVEQRLTPYGLELVATGAVDPSSLLVAPSDDERGIWSEVAPTEFAPYAHAMCRIDGTAEGIAPRSVTDIEPRLPGGLRDVVHGAFTGDVARWEDATEDDAAFIGVHGDGIGDGIDCYSLTSSGANRMWSEMHARNGDVDDTEVLSPNGTSFARLTLSDGSEVAFVFMPMLLHDGWVFSAADVAPFSG